MSVDTTVELFRDKRNIEFSDLAKTQLQEALDRMFPARVVVPVNTDGSQTEYMKGGVSFQIRHPFYSMLCGAFFDEEDNSLSLIIHDPLSQQAALLYREEETGQIINVKSINYPFSKDIYIAAYRKNNEVYGFGSSSLNSNPEPVYFEIDTEVVSSPGATMVEI